MSLPLPRTIRLDPSDTVVFSHPAEPGEWAVCGTFLFAGRDIARLPRKEQIAFRTGFAGLGDFGFSTLVIVSPASRAEREAAVEALSRLLVAHLGAPDPAAARGAAEEEVAFAEGLCAGHSEGTLIALQRELREDGAIRERFRTLRPRSETSLGATGLRGHAKAFFAVETDGSGPDDGPRVDLIALLKGRSK